MKTITAGLVLTVGILFASMLPSIAQSSAPSMQAMPKCAAGDSVVGVNTTTKMYMTKSQMMAKTAGMSPSEKQAMMAKHHVKMMCKSEATAMGAKPMNSPPM